MKKTAYVSLTAVVPLLLAGCGSKDGSVAGGASGKSADWAVDACKTFPSDVAGKAAGVTVVKAETPNKTDTGDVLVSNCSYSTASGDSFGVLLRQDKTAGTTIDTQIAGLKSQPDITGPMEDVAMPKGKAIWTIKMNTLSYVPQDGRMIVVTPPGAVSFGKKGPPAAELKARAIAIANAIES
jgi:hypothetical protein